MKPHVKQIGGLLCLLLIVLNIMIGVPLFFNESVLAQEEIPPECAACLTEQCDNICSEDGGCAFRIPYGNCFGMAVCNHGYGYMYMYCIGY
jgi:hypothetical protein